MLHGDIGTRGNLNLLLLKVFVDRGPIRRSVMVVGDCRLPVH